MKKGLILLSITLCCLVGMSAHIHAYTLSFFSEGFTVGNGAKEHDPTVIVVIFDGPAADIEDLLQPRIDTLANFNGAPNIHFDFTPIAQNSVLMVPDNVLSVAILQNTDFASSIDEHTFQQANFIANPTAFAVSEHDVVLLLTKENTYFKIGDIVQQSDFTVAFQASAFDVVPNQIETPTPTPPPAPEPSSVPEPSTAILLGLGLLGALGFRRWKSTGKGVVGQLVIIALLTVQTSVVTAETVTVYGTDAIFLAGQTDVAIPAVHVRDTSWFLMRYLHNPADNFLTETVPQVIPVQEHSALSIRGTGHIHYGYGLASSEEPGVQPDGIGSVFVGNTFHNAESKLGISGYAGMAGALAGVFLDDSDPSTWQVLPGGSVEVHMDGRALKTPFWATYPDGNIVHAGAWNAENIAVVRFDTTRDSGFGTNWRESHPDIGQVFYIGDGLTGSGTGDAQQFFVPPGATRLFLGVADAWGLYEILGTEGISAEDVLLGSGQPALPGYYTDNDGSFTVEVQVVSVPLFTVKKSGTGSGTVLIGEEECGPACQEKNIPYTSKTMVVLKAQPEPGSRFVHWETAAGDVVAKEVFAKAHDTLVAVFEGTRTDKSLWIVGEWEFQDPEYGFRIKIEWNEARQRFEGRLTKLEPILRCAGFLIEELGWIGIPAEQPGVIREQSKSRWFIRTGPGQCLPLGQVEWTDGLVDVNRWPSRDQGIFDIGKDMIRIHE